MDFGDHHLLTFIELYCTTLIYSFLSDPPAGGRCRVAMSGKQEVAAATAQAEKAFGAWSAMTAKSRAAVMFRFHALLEKHAEELVSWVSVVLGREVLCLAVKGFEEHRSGETPLQPHQRFMCSLQRGSGPLLPNCY